MSNNIHFVQLADYEAPKITENKRDEWVDFGETNNYYQFLIDRYNGSTTNNAVINNICITKVFANFFLIIERWN